MWNKRWILLLLFLLMLIFTPLGKENVARGETEIDEGVIFFIENFKEKIKNDLKEQVPESYIEKLFSSKLMKFSPEVMIRSLTWNERSLPYHNFLKDERIEKAKKFILENRELLEKIEGIFQVEKELIVAILLVESDLGNSPGKYEVFDQLFNLALSGEEELFKKYLPESISLEDEAIKTRYKRRSKWAYKELLALITIGYQKGLEILNLKGSIFGAFGYSQFVPSSYVIYGYDFDGDGKVDLFSLPDALASIANYLKGEGYRVDSPLEFKKRIVMRYNFSEPYAETVLSLSEALKERLNLVQKLDEGDQVP